MGLRGRPTFLRWGARALRAREVHVRADYARKVARLWEEQLGDAKEATDAWRRVLRMKKDDKDNCGTVMRRLVSDEAVKKRTTMR